MRKVNRKYLIDLATDLDQAERMGCIKDEPEGTRFIQISDTLAAHIAEKLFKIVKEEGGL